MNSSKTAPKVEPARHWINGEWIGSSTVANSVSPSTGEVLGQYSAGGRTEAASAIAAARNAFDNGTWAYDPHDPNSQMGPVIDKANVERIDRIVKDASRYAWPPRSSPKISIAHTGSPAPSKPAPFGPTHGQLSATLSKRAASSTVASDARGVLAPWRNFRK